MRQDLVTLLESARARLAMTQETLASLVGVRQQTVSRWENGASRPGKAMIGKLASALSVSAEEITTAIKASEWGAAESTSPDKLSSDASTLPVRPLTALLPLNGLTAETFERFVTDLLDRQFPDAAVSQLGGQGDDQRGYDILIVQSDGRRVGVQCKREQQFGPKKVEKAINAAELEVDQSIIALARSATAEARFEVDKHDSWSLLDQADLSRRVRQLPDENALYLLRTYFPDHVEAFLGIPVASPWMSTEEFYRVSTATLLNHRQPLAGRSDLVVALVGWASDPSTSDIAVVVGRGGLGKSKLLWEVATSADTSELSFRFLAVGQQPAPADFDLLPRTDQLVLVLDDAHGIDGVAGIVAQLRLARPRAKVLLAVRPYGETQIDTDIWSLNQSPRSVPRWQLEDLSPAEASEMVSGLIGRPVYDPFTQQLASVSADCPFVAVVAADLLRTGALTSKSFSSDAALRTGVLQRFSDQMTGGKSGSDANERRAVLTAIAAFQPIRLDESDFEAALTALTKIESFDAINGRVRELEDAGLVLRRGGSAVRVVPDMFGDVLLGQAAFDDRLGRSTSFLTRAQKAASGAPLQHLLVNASRMDWQVRDGAPGRTEAVDSLWSSLRAELIGGTFEKQLALLRLVAKIAYFQPELAIELVNDVRVLPESDSKEDALTPTWAATRADVVHSLAPVLRNVAYHSDCLRSALEILWDLSQDDLRPTNRHSDHPLKVLREIADLRTGKPFTYIHTVIDAATEWLNKPFRYSPFDAIDPILAAEGSEQTFSDPTLTFHPFVLNPNSIEEVRDRVIGLAFAEARSPEVGRAVRAVRALEEAVRGPIGLFGQQPSQKDVELWATASVPVIERLGELGKEDERDPAVRIGIRRALRWHAEHSATATRPAAATALASLLRTPEDDLALCLHDGWGSLGLRGGLTHEEAEQARITEYHRVAEAISADRTDIEVLEHLEQRLQIARATASAPNSSVRFLWTFFECRPTAAAQLCEKVLEGRLPELGQNVAPALAALATAGDDRAIAFAKSMLASDSPRLQAAAAWALTWNRGGRTIFLTGELELLSDMAVHRNDDVRGAVGRGVYVVAMVDKAVALDLLAKIELRQSSSVAAEALSSFGRPGPLEWSDTTTELREAMLRQLIECNTLDEYELMTALGGLSVVDPLGVTKMLMARVDRESELHAIEYEALPGNRWDPPLRVHETAVFERCLVEVRDWMTRRGHAGGIRNSDVQLYQAVAGDWPDQAIATVASFSDASDQALLVTVARILASAPSPVLFRQVPVVTRLLRRAQVLGKASEDLIFQSLLPTNQGVFAMWSGVLPEKEVRERDEARGIANNLPRGSIEQRFFNTLADALEWRIQWTMDRPARPRDGREW